MKREKQTLIGHHRIKRVRVIGGFLDGIDLAFTDGLNCIIGPRGAGKTTIIEMIRFGLDDMPGREGDPLRKRIESLIKENLNGGRVEIVIETKEGITYTITRVANESSIVIDDTGHPVPGLKVHGGFLFKADVFSQNQMENIAETSHYQLDLLDKFRESDLAQITMELHEIRHNVEANANAQKPLLTKRASLENDLKQLPNLETKLAAYKQTGGSDSSEINRGYAHKALRDRELRAIDEVAKVMANIGTTIKSVVCKLNFEIDTLFTDEMIAGPNGPLLKKIISDLRGAANKSDARLNEAFEVLRPVYKGLQTEKENLENIHKTQELEFLKGLEKQKQVQTQSAERTKAEKLRNELIFKQRELAEIIRQIEKLEQDRADLLKQLNQRLDDRFALRSSVAKELNNKLLPNIRVRVQQYGNREDYRLHLETVFRGASMHKSRPASKISAALSPSELVELVKQGDATLLEERCNLGENQAAVALELLGKPDQLFALELMEMDDVPAIELSDRGEYKESSALSTGQKCTVILPILLLESVNPLLVDQPEDNLDNRYVYDTVVENVLRVKRSRQLIFVTHNPNIPVLGDASLIAVMNSNGRQASIVKVGDVDSCKEDIVNLLEGGEEAFKARQIRYKLPNL